MHRFPVLAVFFALSAAPAIAGDELKPLLAVPDTLALAKDFSTPERLERDTWQQRQHTRWAVEDGVLRGRPSTLEYQKSTTHHQGFEPRVSCPATPEEFVAKFSIRFIGGSETNIAPFIEFGHHVARVRFSEEGVFLLADGESVQLDASNALALESGKWLHALAELKGEEFVIQFAGGPTLFAKHPSYAQPVKSGGAGFGVAGTKGGIVEIDDVELWTIKPKPQPDWEQTKKRFDRYEPVILKERK